MANNIWSNYTEKTATPVDADEVMVRDSTDGKNKRLLFGAFWKWVAKKLNEATISELQTNNKTIIGAINALNSDKFVPDYSHASRISMSTEESNISWTAPSNGYIIGSGYGDGQPKSFIYVTINGVKFKQQSSTTENISVLVPVKAKDEVIIHFYLSTENVGMYFVPAVP